VGLLELGEREYPKEELKNIRIAINQLREAVEAERTESSILLNKIHSTLTEKLSKLEVVNKQILMKLPSIKTEDLQLLFRTMKDLQHKFKLVPFNVTRNSDNFITQVKYSFLDEVITVDLTRDSNNFITSKAVKIERE